MMIDDDGSEYSNNSGSAGSNDSSSSGSLMDVDKDDEVTKTLSKAIAIDKSKIDKDLLERINEGDQVIKGKHSSEETTLLLAMAASSIKNPTTKAAAKEKIFAASKIPPSGDIINSNGQNVGRIIECKKDNVVYIRADGAPAMTQYFKDKGFTAGISEDKFVQRHLDKNRTVHTLSISLPDDSQEYTDEDMGWTVEGGKWADTWPYKDDNGCGVNCYGGIRSSANADETTGEKKICFCLYGLNATKDGKDDEPPMMKYTRGQPGVNKTSITNRIANGGLGDKMIRNGVSTRLKINEYGGLLEKDAGPLGFIEEVTLSYYNDMKDPKCGTADAPSKRYKTEILPYLNDRGNKNK